MVEFMVPEDGLPWTDFDGTDEKKATVMVNPKIMVASNMAATIEPVFVDGASPVALMPGMDNMPFQFVAWSAMQYDVVMNGAMFAIRKASIGANQEMMPTGDPVYMTCGPFECAMGDMAPEISIANSDACSGWMPDVMLEVGKVDNDTVGDDESTSDTTEADDGIDLGWVYSSSLAFSAKHDFGTYSATGTTGGSSGHGKGSNMAMTMSAIDDAITADKAATTDPAANAIVACEDSYGTVSNDTLKPRGCFRLHATEDFISEYELTLTPKGAGVTWGDSEVEWTENPFKDLKCDSVSVMASDHVDICAMFEEEVQAALVKGTVLPVVSTVGSHQRLVGLNLSFDDDVAGSKNKRINDFNAMWYRTARFGTGAKAVNDLYDSSTEHPGDDMLMGAGSNPNLVKLTDDDNDPMYGDLGKVDLRDVGVTTTSSNLNLAQNFDAADDAAKCSDDDGGTAAKINSAGTTITTRGSLCDAMDVEIPVTVDFHSLMTWKEDHSCKTSVEFTITCDWDASGEMPQGGTRAQELPSAFNQGEVAHFLKCSVSS